MEYIQLMDSIAALANAGHELKWSQPSLKMEYELRSPDALVASLKFRSSWGTFATAESADGAWTFKRIGFFQNRVTIRNAGLDENVASFKNNTWSSGGTLELPDGRKFKATTNIWQTNLQFQTESEAMLVRFNFGGVFRKSAVVEISPIGRNVRELPLLVLFGWYLAIMLDQDSTTTAAVVASSG
jgi:hypothetical protein